VSSTKKKAWDEFSKYIRRRDSTYIGIECYTCGKYITFETAQAGHFQPGRHKIFLFDERQVHAQCFQCNGPLKGNWPKYYEHMIRDYGQEVVNEMIAQKYTNDQWKVFELEEIYRKYSAKLKGVIL
jgi:DNA-directed RNA polymerase subunit N (RpoN/RPB10)